MHLGLWFPAALQSPCDPLGIRFESWVAPTLLASYPTAGGQAPRCGKIRQGRESGAFGHPDGLPGISARAAAWPDLFFLRGLQPAGQLSRIGLRPRRGYPGLSHRRLHRWAFLGPPAPPHSGHPLLAAPAHGPADLYLAARVGPPVQCCRYPPAAIPKGRSPGGIAAVFSSFCGPVWDVAQPNYRIRFATTSGEEAAIHTGHLPHLAGVGTGLGTPAAHWRLHGPLSRGGRLSVAAGYSFGVHVAIIALLALAARPFVARCRAKRRVCARLLGPISKQSAIDV